jgi:hypothetical protein
MIGETTPIPPPADPAEAPQPTVPKPEVPGAGEEFGGRDGLDPTRYGDWEKNGRCIDF